MRRRKSYSLAGMKLICLNAVLLWLSSVTVPWRCCNHTQMRLSRVRRIPQVSQHCSHLPYPSEAKILLPAREGLGISTSFSCSCVLLPRTLLGWGCACDIRGDGERWSRCQWVTQGVHGPVQQSPSIPWGLGPV